MKMTPARRKALTWISANEPVSAFPCDGTAPDLKFVHKLEKDGLIDRVGKEAGVWGFTKFALSSAGRAALEQEGTRTNER